MSIFNLVIFQMYDDVVDDNILITSMHVVQSTSPALSPRVRTAPRAYPLAHPTRAPVLSASLAPTVTLVIRLLFLSHKIIGDALSCKPNTFSLM